jgi:DNA-binding LacI/PurR family transcriptional regulator
MPADSENIGSGSGGGLPKYQQVYGELARGIRIGRWKHGQKLPSEAELVRQFGASRITVGRAVRELQQAGLVERRAGSGTYVRSARSAGALSFGLLIPELGETEILERICQGMMASPRARAHALLWGSLDSRDGTKEERAWEQCRRYLDRKVAGVFFAPVEHTPASHAVNRRILAALDAASVPVVLLDRAAVPYPERGTHDRVGLDNRRAGFVVTDHLLAHGARRVAFLAVPYSASTVDEREAGYREALHARGVAPERGWAGRLDPADGAAVRAFLDAARPDGIVCANDGTAARLMRALAGLGVRIPDDVRLVGIDDVEYAALLPSPLTTLRQPTRQVGAVALGVMLDRIAQPDLPPRDILLHGALVVRESCGSTPCALAAAAD